MINMTGRVSRCHRGPHWTNLKGHRKTPVISHLPMVESNSAGSFCCSCHDSIQLNLWSMFLQEKTPFAKEKLTFFSLAEMKRNEVISIRTSLHRFITWYNCVTV